MTAPIDNTFFADPAGLTALRSDAKARDPSALKEVAKQFESLFTQMLMKSMREANSSFGESMFESNESEFYQDMFDDQMAVHLAQGRGLGLADMLVRQLQGAVPSQGTVPNSGSGLPLNPNAVEPALLLDEQVAAPITLESKTPAPAATTSHAVPMSASKRDFIRSMWPHAEAAAKEIGVDPHALLAQAALETGWGKSVPCNAAGECSFNLFGIKAGSQWSGSTVNVPTLEFEDGVAVRKVERFRSYESPADSFKDYARLIGGNSRYENVMGTGDNVAAFASGLQRGGYATDPNYARKIVAVSAELRKLTSGGA